MLLMGVWSYVGERCYVESVLRFRRVRFYVGNIAGKDRPWSRICSSLRRRSLGSGVFAWLAHGGYTGGTGRGLEGIRRVVWVHTDGIGVRQRVH